MNRAWAMRDVAERKEELDKRYVMLCHGRDEKGREVAPATAATNRSLVKRDLRLLSLLGELLAAIDDDEVELSDDAEEGFERLVEPLERHRLRR